MCLELNHGREPAGRNRGGTHWRPGREAGDVATAP